MKQEPKGILEPLKAIEGFEAFVEAMRKNANGKVVGAVEASKGHLIYGFSYYANKKPLVVAHDEVSAKKIYEDLQYLYGESEVYLYPARDILFYNADVHSMDITAERMKIIEKLVKGEAKAVVVTIESLLNPLSPKETWIAYTKYLEEGQQIQIDELIKYLIDVGYERVAKVEGVGQFAIRGGIIDIFTPTAMMPHRIELFDDEIDSIRMFNIGSQRSIEKTYSLTINPNQEIIFPITLMQRAMSVIKDELKSVVTKLRAEGKKESARNIEEQVKEDLAQIEEGTSGVGLETYLPYTNLKTVTLLDYLGKDYCLYIDEPTKTKDRCERIYWEYEESMKDRLEYGHILPRQIDFIFGYETVMESADHLTNVYLQAFESDLGEREPLARLELRVYENNTFYKSLDLLEKDLNKFKKEKKRIILLSGIKSKGQRIIEELEERGIQSFYSENLEVIPNEGQIIVSKGSLGKGFLYEDIGFCIISDKDLFGKEKKKPKAKKKYQGSKIESFLELVPGDYVVHENHGIGVFKGVEQIIIEGISRDNLKIEYSDGSMLYVNINQMDMVQKYVGAEGKPPKLSKLGTQEWKKSKAKVKSAVKDIAKDLIKLYSKRQHTRGFSYEEDNIWQMEFEQMFPYEETGDQIEAIEEVKKDMESEKIMDRLVCGDVGYGKTEVAIRAAFKSVQNSKQVAYLVPTTILAQQHYERFKERMTDYPISVGVLSRFRTPKQVKETLEGIEKGTVDIVIGTHRLLSKDVRFKDLGLVIIDEEQRFGVTHKEKLKEMRTEVDVLTLTATPIPRTLHMSLIGVRDMSVLEEAPLERRPVQTYVIEYSEDFIKDAIHRELTRDGQVYFLHNQVKNIEEVALKIQKMVPEARVGFAHGQMSERELEKIMLSFIEKEINVLVCTTIVETGLDIANANTMIINDADRMGLSQLYQLRGRVGRSNKIAYAYLMYQKNKVLKEIAEKRLQAIKQFTQLGAGFKIAMRDLEIRGAGNLLGAQQHGHMEAIGYDLYCKMLQQAVSLEKGEEVKESFETSIEMKINAYIPGQYIVDEVQKLDIYKRIASIVDEKDYYDVQEEVEDRYGEMPISVQNLLDVALIKAEANHLDMISVAEANHLDMISVAEANKQLILTFRPDAELNPEALPAVIEKYGRKMKFVSGKNIQLRVDVSEVAKKELISYIKNILQDLKKLKNS
ncbi:MAG: transcription-repair coupling factor [Cellulosilyticaceae bacterium]